MHYQLAGCILEINIALPRDSKWHLFKVTKTENIFEGTSVNEKKDQRTLAKIEVKEEISGAEKSKRTATAVLDEQIYNHSIEKLIRNSVFHFHSSFVLYKGQAILFTGPSGIGKTTQAELWRNYEGAIIVNGDVTLVRKINGCWKSFGLPLHGSTPYCENLDAPVKAVVVLKQSLQNSLIRLNGFTALSECLPEIYRPPMQEKTQEILYDTIDAFFSEIPIYQLSCRPDQEAVMLVKNKMFCN